MLWMRVYNLRFLAVIFAVAERPRLGGQKALHAFDEVSAPQVGNSSRCMLLVLS